MIHPDPILDATPPASPEAAPGAPAQRLFRSIEHDAEGAYGRFKSYRLGSAFQPIYSLAHHRAVGFEALLRARNDGGEPVSPLEVFACAEGEEEIIRLDRVCRAMHVDNHRRLATDEGWLFLNTDPRVVLPGARYGSFFAEMLEHYGLPARRVVVEILEGAIDDEGRLAAAVEYYRGLGCLVAVDDFGAGHSNFDRIWRLAPDIVKLDRSVIVQSTSNRHARRMLPNLVSLIHEAGSLVLAEGVETEEEALLSIDAEVDMVQGYHFARPAPATPQTMAKHPRLTELCDTFRGLAATGEERRQRALAPYRLAFDHAAASLGAGVELEVAAYRLMNQPAVKRCYLLDARGYQVAAILPAWDQDERFTPLANEDASSWFRRRYFRRALARPGQQYTSPPYLSLTGVHLCVTLSMALPLDGETLVLCCDLDWDALDPDGPATGA
ncbi:sensor domain-containing phosphodiesterase [Endothiovibrio diazotrophicus]